MKHLKQNLVLPDFGNQPDNLTPLYALPVLNGGTDVTQSLSSYVATLAARHRLSVVTLLYFISNYCRIRHIPGPSVKYVQTCRLDAGGKYAVLLVDVLRLLTGVSVSGCCWLKLERALAGNFWGIVRATRQWCGQCYKDSRDKFGIVYEPLIWSYPGVTACPAHNVRYESLCHYCGQLQPIMGGQLDHWYCNYCKSELVRNASRSDLRVDSKTAAWNAWLHRELGLLITGLWDPMFVPNIANFRRFVSWLAKDDMHGYKGLSNRTGIDANTLSQWVRRGPPAFHYLIRFCAALGVSPRTALTAPMEAVNELGEWPATIPVDPRQKRLNVTTNDWPRIRHQMQLMINGTSPIPTADEICRILGVSSGTLRYREPKLLRQLVTKRICEKANARKLARSNQVALGRRIFKEMRRKRGHLARRTFEREFISRSGCGYKIARAVYSLLIRCG